MSTATDEHTEIVTTSDPAQAAHIVRLPPHLRGRLSPQAYVLEARVTGTPVTALCGYTWVPEKDPQKYPVCQACLDIYHAPGKHRDDREDLPDA